MGVIWPPLDHWLRVRKMVSGTISLTSGGRAVRAILPLTLTLNLR